MFRRLWLDILAHASNSIVIARCAVHGFLCDLSDHKSQSFYLLITEDYVMPVDWNGPLIHQNLEFRDGVFGGIHLKYCTFAL